MKPLKTNSIIVFAKKELFFFFFYRVLFIGHVNFHRGASQFWGVDGIYLSTRSACLVITGNHSKQDQIL